MDAVSARGAESEDQGRRWVWGFCVRRWGGQANNNPSKWVLLAAEGRCAGGGKNLESFRRRSIFSEEKERDSEKERAKIFVVLVELVPNIRIPPPAGGWNLALSLL
jgi:hypothetical protein